MPVKYYPNRVSSIPPHSIDRAMESRKVLTVSGSKEIDSDALSNVVSFRTPVHINSIKISFSNSTNRDFSVKILNGLNVLRNLNDYIWLMGERTLPQRIKIDEGFYTGTEFATHLQGKINTNTAFDNTGVTVTVAYADATGLFTITANDNIKYFHVNPHQTHLLRDSIGGILMGLEEDHDFSTEIVSDTPVFGLNQASWIINEEDSDVQENYFDDLKILGLDQALLFETNTANTQIFYTVNYESIL